MKTICGIQQVGIGVKNVQESWPWYLRNFGFDVKVFEAEGVAEKMLPFTGGKPQPRFAVLAYNLRGGGGFEIWEPRGRELNYIKDEPKLGDLGLFVCKIKSPDVVSCHLKMKEDGINILSQPTKSPSGNLNFFVKDPWNNVFQVEEDNYSFINEKKLTGGVNGMIIGVSDMEKSIKFYSELTDYDKIVYDETGVFEDFKGINGGEHKIRRVLLKRSKPLYGPLSEVMGTSHLELVQYLDDETKHTPVKIFEGRLWGDPGYIHLCFDVRDMDAVEKAALELGHEFVCDGGKDFDMGDANGHFTYVEDPDGALIEFVETYKVPIMKKWGLYLHLKNRDEKKPLPRFMTKALRFLKVK